MISTDVTHDDVIRKAAIARAAALAAEYTGDKHKRTLAEKELDRLAKIDFSATNAGVYFVDSLVEDGIEIARRTLPFRKEKFGRDLQESWGTQGLSVFKGWSNRGYAGLLRASSQSVAKRMRCCFLPSSAAR